MKKILLLLLLSVAMYGQVPADATPLENIQITNNVEDNASTKVTVQNANGVQNWKFATSLPISTAVANALDLKVENSAGAIQGFAITDNGNGTVNIATGTAYLRTTNDPYSPLIKYVIPAVTNLALTDNANNFVLVDYNGGTPALTVTIAPGTINTTTNSIAYLISRVGTTLDYINLVGQNIDANGKLRRRFLNSESLRRASGAVLTASNRNLLLTAGLFYSGLIEATTPAFNTSTGSTFTQAYLNGSTWVRSTGNTQINNTQYSLAGVLTTMPTNDYRVDYIYTLADNPSKLYVLLGTTTYNNITNARLAPVPVDLPTELQYLGARVGRVIIQKNATTTETTSEFATIYQAGTAQLHNDLGGLNLGDFQHLTVAEKANFEVIPNKQNSLAVDGTNTKYPTVTAVNAGLGLKASLTGATFTGQVEANSSFGFKTQGSLNLTSNGAGLVAPNSGNISFLTNNASDPRWVSNAPINATSFINSSAPATNALLANGTTLAVAPITGGTGYIQNQNASAQSANMWISGSGTFGGDVTLGGNLVGNGNPILKTIWGGAYGGALQIKTDGSTVDRYSRIGMVNGAGTWIGGMTINNDLEATFASSVTANSGFRYLGDSFGANASGLFFNGAGNYGSGILSDALGTTLKLQAGGGTKVTIEPTGAATFASTVTASNGQLIGGTGTTNFLSKFTSSGVIGNSMVFDNGTNVGIGINSTVSRFHVGNRNISRSSNSRILVSENFDNTTIGNGHAFSDSSLITQSPFTAYASYDARIELKSSSITGDHYVSYQAAPSFDFSGTISNVWGSYITSDFINGTVANNFGLYVANPTKTGGVLNNNTGLYIQNQTAGTQNYSIFSEGGRNALLGSLSIGDTNPSSDATFSLFSNSGDHFKLKRTGQTDRGILVSGGDLFCFGTWANPTQLCIATNGNTLLGTTTDNVTDKLQVNGSTSISSLSGTGTRTVVASSTGQLSAVSNIDYRNYKVYTALLTQTGTNAPVATVLENTLGGSVVWSYSNTGVYVATLSGAFTSSKTTIQLQNTSNNGVVSTATGTNNFLSIATYDLTGSSANGKLTDSFFEIRVYN